MNLESHLLYFLAAVIEMNTEYKSNLAFKRVLILQNYRS